MREAQYARAESLSKIRDLVVLGVRHNLTHRGELASRAMAAGIFARESGKAYTGKSVYRYLYALKALKLDSSVDSCDSIVWSDAALELASLAESEAGFDLSPSEKRVFQNQIFTSEASTRFLASFCPNNQPPDNRLAFAQSCKPLYVLRVVKRPVSADSSWPEEQRVVEVTTAPDLNVIHRKAEMQFLYTYRLWCLDAQLIEELKIKEAKRSGVPSNRSHVLYPIRVDNLPSSDEFLDALYKSAGYPRKSTVIPLPRVMYTVCVTMRLRVQDFKDLLLRTWNEHRDLLHLERGPGVLIKGDLISRDRPNTDRFGNHRYYIVVDGTVRSNLVMFPRLPI
jgi:hypothetical protein